MEFVDEDKIKATILYHLRKKRVIGNKHAPFDTIIRGFPSHIGHDIKKIAQQLIKQGLIITKPTSYGLQVSLNKERVLEVEDFIKKILGFDF